MGGRFDFHNNDIKFQRLGVYKKLCKRFMLINNGGRFQRKRNPQLNQVFD